MKSCFSSCACNGSTEVVESETSNEGVTDRGAGGDGGSAVGESVYYDARSSLSDSIFVPLSLNFGTSLDVPSSVVGGSSQAPNDADAGRITHSASTVRHSNKGSKRRLQSTLIFRNKLEETPRVLDSPAGYPGHLTESELKACLDFRRQLKKGAPVRRDMVYCFKEVEEEPYSVCRYLRSRKFDVGETFQMIDENTELWKEGQAQTFFPDPRVALGGARESAFLTQLPLVLGGTARNGCPIAYLVTGKIRVEGMECVTALEDGIRNYIWYFAVHKIKHYIAAAQAKDPSRFVRVQLVLVVDLNGLAFSLLKRVLPVLEKAITILGVFPELLFNVVILNTPRFFAGFWPMIKAFVDPSTAKKFELYSDHSKGNKRLLELISKAELASDFGGSAASTAELVTRDDGSGVSRQIVDLLTRHKHGEATCNFELRQGETAAVTVYTNAIDGAEVSLYRTTENEPVSRVTMTRNAGEPKQRAFFRELAPSLSGPGSYRLAVKRQSGSQTDHFVVVGDVSQA